MVNSLVWTAEEAKYLKAIFQWRDAVSSSDDEERQHQQEEDGKRQHQDQHQQQRPAGQFRILVVGGRGTGKTAILTRFAQNTFRGEGQPPDPSFERGCRHPVTVDVPPVTTTSCSSPPPSSTSTTTNNIAKPQSQPAAQAQKVSYIIDAVEMPSQQLLSNPQLALALSITEAAVLVYSVRDAASLQLAIGLAEFMREYFAPPAPFSSPTPSSLFCARGLLGMGSRAGAGTAGPSSAGAGNGDRGRPYPVVLVGSKCDAPACGPDADPVAILQEERAAMRMPGVGRDVRFLEVSAKTGEGVDGIFRAVAEEILEVQRAARERWELAQREGVRQEAVGPTTGGDDGGRKKFGLWRTLAAAFGRRQPAEGRSGERSGGG